MEMTVQNTLSGANRQRNDAASVSLIQHQRIPTSGARTALPFHLAGDLYLVVPQLSVDMDDVPAGMNGGDSDIDALVYRWVNGRFEEHERLPTPGGEDAHLFQIGADTFLAMASIRTGRGPYDYNATSTIYRRERDTWTVFQRIPTFAARQWLHFSIDSRHFLALAQGVASPGANPQHPRHSCIFEWNGESFQPFQTFDGVSGYNWIAFDVDGQWFLGYADHTCPSLLYRWTGAEFAPFQTFSEHGGRAFLFYEHAGRRWLAFAAIDSDSTLYEWRAGRFQAHQRLGGPGGREFALLRLEGGLFLVRICFIEGTPAAPKTDLHSQLYRWSGTSFELALEFPTFGGTDAEPFTVDGKTFLAVSNSLTQDVRFRQDSIVYEVVI